MGRLPLYPAQAGHQVIPEEDQVVEDSHDGSHDARQCKHPDRGELHQVVNDVVGKESGVQPGQPFDLYRNHEEKQYLHFPVQGGKGEEHGQVDVVHSGGLHGQRDKQIDQEARNDIKHHPKQVEHRKLGHAPLPLQDGADPVVEIQGDGQEKEITGRRHKDKGEQPPDLAFVDDIVGRKAQG